MDVPLCCFTIFMPQQFFNDFQVCSLFYQMCSERIAEQVWIYSFGYSGFMGYLSRFIDKRFGQQRISVFFSFWLPLEKLLPLPCSIHSTVSSHALEGKIYTTAEKLCQNKVFCWQVCLVIIEQRSLLLLHMERERIMRSFSGMFLYSFFHQAYYPYYMTTYKLSPCLSNYNICPIYAICFNSLF